jgi:hypothetical protein
MAPINGAVPLGDKDTDPALIAKAEILLDRAHFSPGEIDGEDGDNYRRALRAFEQANNLPDTGKLDEETWRKLSAGSSEPVLKPYSLSAADIVGPFEGQIPGNLVGMAQLPGLSYSTPAAALAEKFHMGQDLLLKLNPRANFSQKGREVVVANVSPTPLRPGPHAIEVKPASGSDAGRQAETIVVDKPARQVRAYGKGGVLLAIYPATIGSGEKPAPSGDFKVRRVDWNPDFRYDPKFDWKDVKTKRKLTIRPGPNNPVGLVWIDLTARSYGIHGTPVPANIGKTESHGCIRLTNWDAIDLASRVRPGTVVKFEDQDEPVRPSPSPPTSETAAPTSTTPAPSTPRASHNEPVANGKGTPTLVSKASMDPSDYAQCIADLTSKNTVFEESGTVRQEGCELSGAIKLVKIATQFGDIEISGKPAMLCSFGRQFSGWVREVGAPLTLAYTGERLVRIEAGSGFACRARYDKPGAVPSEHAKGDAIDIMSFVLADDRRIGVKQQDTDVAAARDLLRAFRTTACGYFTTVLGPGTDQAHENHLHFDTGVHGTIPNYRICE